MKALRFATLAVLALLAVPHAALAADLGGAPRRGGLKDSPPPSFEPLFSWTGLYVGAHAGYGWSDIDWDNAVLPSGGASDGSGWLAGGQIGYNWQAGSLVFGVEADASAGWIDGSSDCCGHAINALYSLRGRLGVVGNSNRTLFYGTAGAAWADIDYSVAGFGSFSDTQLGWVAGAGIEHALSSNLTARVEYLYYNFEDIGPPSGLVGGGSIDPSLHTVRFGLNLKF